jgi:hypothetical protein
MMPGKPVAARGKRFSPAELEAARRVRLADVIADDLVVLFCGANPGLSSAAARARRRAIAGGRRCMSPGSRLAAWPRTKRTSCWPWDLA